MKQDSPNRSKTWQVYWILFSMMHYACLTQEDFFLHENSCLVNRNWTSYLLVSLCLCQVVESSKRWWKCRNRFDEIGFVPFNILEPVSHAESPGTQRPPKVTHIHTQIHTYKKTTTNALNWNPPCLLLCATLGSAFDSFQRWSSQLSWLYPSVKSSATKLTSIQPQRSHLRRHRQRCQLHTKGLRWHPSVCACVAKRESPIGGQLGCLSFARGFAY